MIHKTVKIPTPQSLQAQRANKLICEIYAIYSIDYTYNNTH